MPQDLSENQSTLVRVMAWCRLATSHYLSQCWPRAMSTNGVTRPQLVNDYQGSYVFIYSSTIKRFITSILERRAFVNMRNSWQYLQLYKKGQYLQQDTCCRFTHCGLVTPYDVGDLPLSTLVQVTAWCLTVPIYYQESPTYMRLIWPLTMNISMTMLCLKCMRFISRKHLRVSKFSFAYIVYSFNHWYWIFLPTVTWHCGKHFSQFPFVTPTAFSLNFGIFYSLQIMQTLH